MAEVRRSKQGYEKFQSTLKELGNNEAAVGWFDNAKYEDGTQAAYVASIQEFGHGKIPPRLGMRQTIIDKKESWRAEAEKASRAILKGKISGHDALVQLSGKAEADFVKHISSNPGPPLTDLTLALRYIRDKGVKITGTIVGATAARLWDEFYGGRRVGKSKNTKALNDTGYLISTLTSVVKKV